MKFYHFIATVLCCLADHSCHYLYFQIALVFFDLIYIYTEVMVQYGIWAIALLHAVPLFLRRKPITPWKNKHVSLSDVNQEGLKIPAGRIMSNCVPCSQNDEMS